MVHELLSMNLQGSAMLLQLLCLIFLVPAVLCCAYYLFLAAAALLTKEEQPRPWTNADHTFAILIPAHNEETVIPVALRACADLDYPADKFKTYVIADNCTDDTAAVAAAAGAIVLERHDDERRGKGPALAWGLEKILTDRPDAVVVLDADCRLDRHALRSFDEQLSAGAAVLQASYVAANPEASVIGYTAAVGNRLENELFYRPKSRLGLAVLLRGTGMVFRREVLEQHPWHLCSVTEDSEYTLDLLRAGLRVRFLPHVKVISDFPTHAEQLRVQRQRWAAGNLRLGKAWALSLLLEGIAGRCGALLDFGWTLLVLSRPLVLAEAFVALLLAALCAWLKPGALSAGMLATGLGVILLQGIYVALGVVELGLNRRRVLLLAGSAVAFGRMLGITLGELLGRNTLTWTRTPRRAEQT